MESCINERGGDGGLGLGPIGLKHTLPWIALTGFLFGPLCCEIGGCGLEKSRRWD